MNYATGHFKKEKRYRKKKRYILTLLLGITCIVFTFFNFIIIADSKTSNEIIFSYQAKINGNDAIVNVDLIDKHHYANVFYEYCEPLIIGGCRNKSQSITIKIK